ncbi:molybdopterin adenylyltransferase [Desulfuromusa kysingii]|uniref:Molybdopterin adenylyltransferase n=1 Tax=Desulfuromusa kysingii TaxID=37625 RepID=A0A1H4BZT7_9BACT|nr:MogA/MoaB family molybdenum cofactor biosynthesis protein [Desulfuromusa kysingii]SEA53332.1 molybdopterin adenylyltransferase [Desulfuromusa kysingii]
METKPYQVGILTLSDKGACGEREDESGPLLKEMVSGIGKVLRYQIIADDQDKIMMMLSSWVDDLGLDLILTTGGTGLSPRDVTPQATLAVIDYQVPGMAEAMRAASMKITDRAMLSRAIVGVRHQTLIVNLPGSPRSVKENFEVLLPVLQHALDKLTGDTTDCALS